MQCQHHCWSIEACQRAATSPIFAASSRAEGWKDAIVNLNRPPARSPPREATDQRDPGSAGTNGAGPVEAGP